MSDTILALYQYVMKNDLFLQYIDDPEEYQSNLTCAQAARDRLQALLNAPEKKELELFLDMKTVADSLELEAAFTSGLAVGLQLLRLL